MPAIGAVIAWIVAKITSKSFFLGIQIAVTFLMITGHVAILGFAIYAITFIYNKINDLLNIVSTIPANNEILNIALDVLKALGVFDAFNAVYAIFSPFLIAYLVYRVGMIAFRAYERTSNEVFKVGVLTQQ